MADQNSPVSRDELIKVFKEAGRQQVAGLYKHPLVVLLVGFFALTTYFSYNTLITLTNARDDIETTAELQDEVTSRMEELWAKANRLTDPSAFGEIRQLAGEISQELAGIDDPLDRAAANAYLLHVNGHTDDAVAQLRSVAAAVEFVDSRRAARAWFSIGKMLQTTTSGGVEVIEAYTDAIRLDPMYPDPLNNRGVAYATAKRYEDADMDFRQAIRLLPNDFRIYHNRAFMNYERGHYREAIVDYDVAVNLAPESAITLKDRGLALAKAERVDESRRDLEAALNISETAGNTQVVEMIRQALSELDSE